jgi:hypothetical protein
LLSLNAANSAFTLLSNSAAIDAGNDAAAHNLALDVMGDGFPRLLGSHVDIGASEAHVVEHFGVGQVYGTNLDDVITLTDQVIGINRIGSIPNLLGSISALDVDTLAGDDHVYVAATTPTFVNRPPHIEPVEDQVTTAGTQLQFTINAFDFDEPSSGLNYSFVGNDHGASISGGIFTWTPDFTIAEQTTFSFQVKVTDNGAPQQGTTIFSGTPALSDIVDFSVTVLPPVPTNIHFDGGANDRPWRYILWDAAEGAVGYDLQQRIGDGGWTDVADFTPDNLDYPGYEFDNGVESSDSPYLDVSFRVRAFNASGARGPYSEPVRDYWSGTLSPLPYWNFTAQGATVTWSANQELDPITTEWIVERLASSAEGWIRVFDGTPTKNGTQYSYTDTNAVQGSHYVYAVDAVVDGFVVVRQSSVFDEAKAPPAIDLTFNDALSQNPPQLACSPKVDPDVMRVIAAQEGKETLDVDEAKEAA